MLAVVRGRRCKGKEWDYVRKEMTDEGMEKVEWGRKMRGEERGISVILASDDERWVM